MKNERIYREVAALSSGTLAGLCGRNTYEAIEAFLERWLETVATQDEPLEDWRDAYAAFLEDGGRQWFETMNREWNA